MTLSIQDKLALIYTSAGSQRQVAALVGVSHQKIGRALRLDQEGGYRSTSRALKDPAFVAGVESAFKTHTARTIARAKADGLPHRAALPVYLERMPKTVKERRAFVNRKTGEITHKLVIKRDAKGRPLKEPGERAAALHTHWLSDKLRNRWLASMYETRKFLNVSIGSVVNLALYNRQAEARRNEAGTRFYPSRSSEASRTEIRMLRKKRPPIDRQMIQTPYVSMGPGQYPSLLVENVQEHLTRKHQPATGDPGTFYAMRVLLQTQKLTSETKRHEKTKRSGKGSTQGRANRAR